MTRSLALALPAALLAVVQCRSSESLSTSMPFDEYMHVFGRNYAKESPEYHHRRALYDMRLDNIRSHNNQESAWVAGVNKFTDQTDAELKSFHGWRRGSQLGGQTNLHFSNLMRQLDHADAGLDSSVDWTEGAKKLKSLEHVEDQSTCGSCWAFATATMLNAHWEIHTTGTKKFSPQELVDCVPNPKECGGSGGCDGATVELAMEYVSNISLAKLRTLDDYAYLATDQDCKEHPALIEQADLSTDDTTVLQLKSFRTLETNVAEPLMRAVMEGPVAVSASATGWFHYAGGVYDSCVKDSVINHAIVMVGYGGSGGRKWWKIRNSWGPAWGESGSMRIKRFDTPQLDTESHCGTDDQPADGISCKPYPDSVPICGMCGILYDSVAPMFETEFRSTAPLSLRGTAPRVKRHL